MQQELMQQVQVHCLSAGEEAPSHPKTAKAAIEQATIEQRSSLWIAIQAIADSWLQQVQVEAEPLSSMVELQGSLDIYQALVESCSEGLTESEQISAQKHVYELYRTLAEQLIGAGKSLEGFKLYEQTVTFAMKLWKRENYSEKETLALAINKLEQAGYVCLGAVIPSTPLWQNYQAQVQSLRKNFILTMEQVRGSAVTQAQSQFTENIKGFLGQVLKQVSSALGEAPCSYCWMGIGSISREGMFPYSDVDCALLIADEQYRSHPYFERIVKLFAWQLNLLGESEAVGGGLRIDSGDIGNLLVSRDLLNTPQGMTMQFAPSQSEAYAAEPYSLHRPVTLYDSTGVGTKESGIGLIKTYQQMVAADFQAMNSQADMLTHQRLGLSYLKEHQRQWKLRKQRFDTINIKNDYLSPLTYWCLDIALYHGFTRKDALTKTLSYALSIPQALEQLRSYYAKDTYCQDFFNRLESSYHFIHQLRTKLHAVSGQQQDEAIKPGEVVDTKGVKVYRLTAQEWQQLEALEHHLLEPAYSSLSLETLSEHGLIQPQVLRFEAYISELEHPSVDRPFDKQGWYEAVRDLTQDLAKRKASTTYYRHYITRLPDAWHSYYVEQVIKAEQGINQDNERLRRIVTLLETYLQEDGRRSSTEKSERAWQAQVKAMLQAEPPKEHEGLCVRVEGVGYKGYLKSEVVKKLLNAEGSFKQEAKDELPGRHSVIALPELGVHCKQYPELPGMELAVQRLHQYIVGHGVPPSDLLKFIVIKTEKSKSKGKAKNKDKTESKEKIIATYPVLVSETIPGKDFHDTVQEHPNYLKALDLKSYSQLVLMAMLINPEDGKPDNFIVEQVIDRLGKEAYRLISIDNDHAFVEPMVKVQGHLRVQVKTLLFCLDEMLQAIHSEAREELLRLNIGRVLLNWLIDLKRYNEAYLNLFSVKEMQELYGEKGLKGLFNQRADDQRVVIPISVKAGLIVELYDKLRILQQSLRNDPEISHIDLLNRIDGRLGKFYESELESEKNTNQRFYDLTESQYQTHSSKLATRYQTVVNSRQILQSALQAVPDVNDIIQAKSNTPQQALDELAVIQKQEKVLEEAYATLIKGDIRDFSALTSDAMKSQVIQRLYWRSMNEELQVKIFKAMAGISFRQLNLSHSKALTNTLLLPILESSPHLVRLDISHCSKVSETIIQGIANHCPGLEVLNCRYQTKWKSFRAGITTNRFLTFLKLKGLSRLRRLDIRYCEQLRIIDAAMPRLEWVNVKGCAVLKPWTPESRLQYLDLENCSVINHHTFFMRYPFLWGLKLQEATSGWVQEIGKALSNTLLKQHKTCNQLSANEKTKLYELLKRMLKLAKQARISMLSALKDSESDVRAGAAKALLQLEQEGSKEVIRALLTTLKDKNSNVRGAAASALGQLGQGGSKDATSALLLALKHKDWAVRTEVTKALVQLGQGASADVISALLTALKDSNNNVRSAAAMALGQLGQGASEGVISALLTALEDDDSPVRSAAAGALGQLGQGNTAEVISALLSALKDSAEQVRATAARALGQLEQGATSEVINALALVLKGINSEVCRAGEDAFVQLGQGGSKEAISALLILFKDSRLDVREAAARALGKLGHKASAEVISALLTALEDSDRDVRRAAASAMVELGREASAEVICALLTVLKYSDRDVRSAAAGALGKLRREDSANAISALLTVLKDNESFVRATAARSLGQLGHDASTEVISALLTTLKDCDRDVRSAAAGALGQLGQRASAEVISALLTALRDSVSFVRSAAARSLGQLEQRASAEVISALLSGIEDSDRFVREAAARALGMLGKGDTAEVISALLTALKDSDWSVHIAAAEALVQLGQRGSREVISALLTALKDKNSNVREAAAGALGQLEQGGSKDATSALLTALMDSEEQAQVRATAVRALGHMFDRDILSAYLLKKFNKIIASELKSYKYSSIETNHQIRLLPANSIWLRAASNSKQHPSLNRQIFFAAPNRKMNHSTLEDSSLSTDTTEQQSEKKQNEFKQLS